MNEESKKTILSNLDRLRAVLPKLSKYNGQEMTLAHLIYFLLQFPEKRQISIVIRLIEHLQVLDQSKLIYLIKEAYNQIEQKLIEKPLIVPIGGIQDSANMLSYALLKDFFDDEEKAMKHTSSTDSLNEMILGDDWTSIVFFDDNITSGTQLVQFFSELIEGVENPEIVRSPLSSKAVEKLQLIPIKVCYAIRLTEECEDKVQQIRDTFKCDVEIHSGKKDYNKYLDYACDVVESEEEMKYARNFIKSYAKELYKDKDWSERQTYYRTLGYGNLEKLTAFSHNVPKSLLPIFWKQGIVNGKQFFPLLPEAQERKKLIDKNVEREYIVLQAIEGWLKEEVISRLPELEFGFLTDGDLKQEITVEIPSEYYLEQHFLPKLDRCLIEPEDNFIRVHSRPIEFIDNPHSIGNMQSSLDEDRYERYIKDVEKYNQGLKEHLERMKVYLMALSTLNPIEFGITNQGTGTANHVRIKVFYNTAFCTFMDIDGLEKPKFKEEAPFLDNYREGAMIISRSDLEFPILGGIYNAPPEKIEPNEDYHLRLEWERLGFNDYTEKERTFHLLGRTMFQLELPYQINYEESPEAISGVLTITIKEVEDISQKAKEAIEKLSKKLKEFERKPRARVRKR